MTEQWFLDLDGTRSGPYHTPEIMSLIAEGEVLPHHRISTSLKDQAWHTILDWRLDQAKISQSTPKKSGYRAEISPIEVQQNPDEQSATTAVAPATPIILEAAPAQSKPTVKSEEPPAPPAFEPPPTLVDSPFENFPEELPEIRDEERTEEITREIPYSPAIAKNSVPKVQPMPPPPLGEAKPKRDPMAEMFDMVQKTKQKKESKQMAPLQMGMSIETDVPGIRKPSNLGKNLGIGVGIVVIGFALGQLFQNTAQPPLTDVAPGKPRPSPSTSPSSPLAARPKGATETLDRSTDKLMIRANVERRVDVPAPQTAKPIVKLAPRPTAPDALQNEKELEELKTLKKELQELKALKTNSNPLDDISEIDGDGLDGTPTDQPPGFDANGFPLAPPANNPGGIPQNGETNPVR